ncbi:MAG: hypothetical protein R3208_06110 [Ketobacteraceae bacterium]|nr:hypothetical protein [Ketobacteraceae bacterium]
MLVRILMSIFCLSLAACGVDVEVDITDNDQYTFREVTYPGADFTEMVRINNNGKALGRYKIDSYFEDSWGLFVYDIQQDTYQDIPLGDIEIGNTLFALDFNDLGDIVIHDFYPAFYSAAKNEFIVLPLPGEDHVDVRLKAINNTGKIAGYHFPPYGEQPRLKRGFIFDLETLTYEYLNYPGALQTLFFAINDNGYAVAQYFIDDESTAIAVYDMEQSQFMDIPRDTGNWQVSDINNNNVIVVKTDKGDCVAGPTADDPCDYGYWLYSLEEDTLEKAKVPVSFASDTNNSLDFVGYSSVRYNREGVGEQKGAIGLRR